MKQRFLAILQGMMAVILLLPCLIAPVHAATPPEMAGAAGAYL